MKLKHIFALYTAMFLSIGCNQQPIGNTLLSSGNIGTSIVDTTTPEDAGALDIQPDNAELSVNIDNSDRVEITGTCKDLDRKNNRILVEVFAGDDETVEPYISNALSDKCQTTAAGLAIGDDCFWVTKGIGLIDDAGNLFPQCHNGRFGFAVKLGKILVPTSKYTVRFKLRTLEGILSDSTFSRVSVSRALNVPVIDSALYSSTAIQCDIKTSPTRFNFGILYALTRTFTDAASTANAPVTLYSGLTTASTVEGNSVFSWSDLPGGANIIIKGVTYNYTLISTEANFSYVLTPPTPTASSATASCDTDRPQITQLDPGIVTNTCYMKLLDSTANPLYLFGVTYEWGYNTTNTWVGPTFSAQAPAFISPTGVNCLAGQTVCTQDGLISGTTYYFAVREIGGGQIGKWSDAFPCKAK